MIQNNSFLFPSVGFFQQKFLSENQVHIHFASSIEKQGSLAKAYAVRQHEVLFNFLGRSSFGDSDLVRNQLPKIQLLPIWVSRCLAKASVAETKLEAKIIDAMRRREVEGSSMKSFNSIILKFPKIDESFRKCKATFEEFDEDRNGAIDPQELKHCFGKLEINFTDEEINDLFEACDINEDMGMKFSEFIVLLCLVYLLKEDPTAEHSKSRIGMPNLEATFETLVDTFVFLDKNKDGYVSKNEMVDAINETTSGERSSGRIAMKRFEEMDWDKNGMVNFKEFLFAFTHWVGIEDIDDDDDEGEDNV